VGRLRERDRVAVERGAPSDSKPCFARRSSGISSRRSASICHCGAPVQIASVPQADVVFVVVRNVGTPGRDARTLAQAAEVDATRVVTGDGCPVAPGYRDMGVDASPHRLLERNPGG
jgi:hypothetical protein